MRKSMWVLFTGLLAVLLLAAAACGGGDKESNDASYQDDGSDSSSSDVGRIRPAAARSDRPAGLESERGVGQSAELFSDQVESMEGRSSSPSRAAAWTRTSAAISPTVLGLGLHDDEHVGFRGRRSCRARNMSFEILMLGTSCT